MAKVSIPVKACSGQWVINIFNDTKKCDYCNELFSANSNVVIPTKDIGIDEKILIGAKTIYHRFCFSRLIKLLEYCA